MIIRRKWWAGMSVAGVLVAGAGMLTTGSVVAREYDNDRGNSLVGFSSSGEIPEDIFIEPEGEKPWLTRKKKRQPVTTVSPADDVIQAFKLRISTLEKDKAALEVQRVEMQKEVLQLRQDRERFQAGYTRQEALARRVDSQEKEVQRLTGELTENKQTQGACRQTSEEQARQIKSLQAQSLLFSEQKENLELKDRELSDLRQTTTVLGEKVRKGEQELNLAKVESQTLRTKADKAQTRISELENQLKLSAEKQTSLAQALAEKAKQDKVVATNPESHDQKLAYANGVAFANSLVRTVRLQKELGVNIPQDMILAGFNDAFHRRIQLDTPTMTSLVEELDKTLNTRIAERQASENEARQKQSSVGNLFYQQYERKKGVKKIHESLYIIKESGSGGVLASDDLVDILLTGRLPDGKVFDDSGNKKKIQRVRLDSLLPALTEVLTKIRPGGRIEVVLPPSRAFGAEGVPGLIPGDSTLIFDITVIRKVK